MIRVPSTTTPTATVKESFTAIEDRVTQGIDILLDEEYDNKENKPNLSAASRKFNVRDSRFRARWNRQQSKQEREGSNKRLTDAEEAAIWAYLDRLDSTRAQWG